MNMLGTMDDKLKNHLIFRLCPKNQFLHLFILYRRVDSNQFSGCWKLYNDPCFVYNDGQWECRIQLKDLYAEWINETLIVKSPNESSNNISTNVDIVAIITKQPIKHSVLTKLETRLLEVKKIDAPAWYRLIIYLLPTGKGTFYDSYWYPDHDALYNYIPGHLADGHVTITPLLYVYLPKHLTDDHVTITPLIEPFNITGSPQGLSVFASPLSIEAVSQLVLAPILFLLF
jgi:hypothetical protein